jgi:hypothetical protein
MNSTNSNGGQYGSPENLTEDEKLLLEKIPHDATYVSIRKTRLALDWDDERMWKPLESLAAKNLIKTGPGYGGTVRRLTPTPGQVEPDVTVPQQQSVETSLYDPLENVLRNRWAQTMKLDDFIVQTTAKQGRRDTGGTWTRPDLIVVAVSMFDFIPGKFVDAITFEVKSHTNFDVTAIYEALSHLRSATRAYVFVEIPDEHRQRLEELIQNASKEASRHGIGLIIAKKTADFDSWDFIVEETRREPDPASLDSLTFGGLTI